MGKERLDKLIASTGHYSRKEVKQLVRQGSVLVDGRIAARAEEKYDSQEVEIMVDGTVLSFEKYTWLMMNKPGGYLSATEDGKGATVLDLLPEHLQKRGLFPVGRLDKDTEGLLLLTNNGQLAHRLLSPRYHVDKVYFACVEGCLEPSDCKAFARGMTLGDGLVCMPAGLEILTTGAQSTALVTLREGKFHQVKRMLAACGKPVRYLKRVQMGDLKLDESLELGAFRDLSQGELERLTKV